MTEAEIYEFDLNGYILYRDLISPEEISRMNEIIDTRLWKSDRRRRSLLYKYSPGHSAWGLAANLEKYLPLAANDLQRDLLRPPSVGQRTPLDFPELP